MNNGKNANGGFYTGSFKYITYLIGVYKAFDYFSRYLAETSLGKWIADKTGIWPITSTPRAISIYKDIKNIQVKCHYHECARSFQKIISVESYDDAKKVFGLKYLNLNPIVAAKVGDKVVVKLEENINLEIGGNPDLAQVNKELLGITKEQDYEVSLIIAETHSFFVIKNCKTGAILPLGAAPDPMGSFSEAEFHQRTEKTYINKYYRGHEIWDGVRFFQDKSSMKVSFSADAEQVKNIMRYVKNALDEHPNGNTNYAFLGMNCHDHAQNALNAMYGGPKVKMMSMVNADEIDLGDRLVLYALFDSLTTFKYSGIALITTLNNDALRFFIKKGALPVINSKLDKFYDKLDDIPYVGPYLAPVIVSPLKWLVNDIPVIMPSYRWIRDGWKSRVDINSIKKEEIDKQDIDGNTLLHILIQTHSYKDALTLLEKGADPDIKNKWQETPLHLVAADKHDKIAYYGSILGRLWCDSEEDRYKLLEELAKKTKNIDQFDRLNDYTALGFAVLADDPKAIKILVDNGAKLDLKNHRDDNYAHIAQMSHKDKASKCLYELNHELFNEHNTIRQIPAYEERYDFVDRSKHEHLLQLTNHQVYNKLTEPEIVDKEFEAIGIVLDINVDDNIAKTVLVSNNFSISGGGDA